MSHGTIMRKLLTFQGLGHSNLKSLRRGSLIELVLIYNRNVSSNPPYFYVLLLR